MDNQEIIVAYTGVREIYEACARKVADLCSDILVDGVVVVHSVSHRSKSLKSLEKKLRKPGARYQDLSSITDLAALRVITYLSEDVVKVCEIIEREFEIDRERSVDKSQASDPDKFGYASVHYIARMLPGRRFLPEYRLFGDIYFEVQVRSILQHAWAEIEHDLGYKSDIEVPFSIRRRFSRLSSLLELADSEFNSITRDLEKYRKEIGERVVDKSEGVPVDKDTLVAFVMTNPLSRRIDAEIAKAFECDIESEKAWISYVDIKRLAVFELDTIDGIERALIENESLIVAFSKQWKISYNDEDEDEDPRAVFTAGVSMFYLCYVLAAKEHALDKIRSYILQMEMFGEEAAEEFAASVLESFIQAEQLVKAG